MRTCRHFFSSNHKFTVRYNDIAIGLYRDDDLAVFDKNVQTNVGKPFL